MFCALWQRVVAKGHFLIFGKLLDLSMVFCAILPTKIYCAAMIHVLYYQIHNYIFTFRFRDISYVDIRRFFIFYFRYRRYIGTKKETIEDFHLSSSAATRVSLKAVYDGEADWAKEEFNSIIYYGGGTGI